MNSSLLCVFALVSLVAVTNAWPVPYFFGLPFIQSFSNCQSLGCEDGANGCTRIRRTTPNRTEIVTTLICRKDGDQISTRNTTEPNPNGGRMDEVVSLNSFSINFNSDTNSSSTNIVHSMPTRSPNEIEDLS